MLRNVNSGAFEVYDIANNQLTGAAPLGSVGLDWQVGGVRHGQLTNAVACRRFGGPPNTDIEKKAPDVPGL